MIRPPLAPRALAERWRRRGADGGVSGGAAAQLVPQARLGGPMPWVIAIMVALTVVAAASGLALRNAAQAAQAELRGGLTVQVVHAGTAERSRQTRAALGVLREWPGVVALREVPQAELDALVEPWLGARGPDEAEALPVPSLIDVRLSGAVSEARIEALRRALATAAPAARVDAQAGWLGPVFDTFAALQWLAAGLIALLAGATAAAVLLAARSSLAANRTTIEVVHLLGGTDRQIARVFQRSVAIDAAVGGAVGIVAGFVIITLLGREFAALGAGLASAGGLRLTDWLALAAIPFLGVALAMLTARLTVLSALRKML